MFKPDYALEGGPLATRLATTLTPLSRIRSVASALPRNYYRQTELLDASQDLWGGQIRNRQRIEQLYRSVQVDGRHLALSKEEIAGLESFTDANDAYIRCAVELGSEATERALAQAGLRPTDVDHIFYVSVTGIAAPSIDARIAHRLGFRSDVKRTPIFGLGCVAGAAGIARVSDYVKAYPEQVALLVSVELCSLTLQRADTSVRNLIAAGLFGDGAAAVVVEGAGRRGSGPTVLATRSVLYPESEGVMGWDITSDGFRIVLSADVPQVVRQYLRADVDGFLADHDLSVRDIGTWVCHPGGPKVLIALQESLGISEDDVGLTWSSLRRIGNVSSASVLMVLEDTLRERQPAPGSYGVMIGMGPGFCSELVLLRW